jgi:hypothetical protein
MINAVDRKIIVEKQKDRPDFLSVFSVYFDIFMKHTSSHYAISHSYYGGLSDRCASKLRASQ